MRICKYPSVFLLAISIFLNGCAVLDKIEAPSIGSGPATSSFVVVKAEVIVRGAFDITTSQQLQGGVLLRTDGSNRIDGRAAADLIIFPDLPPGEYSLTRIQTTWQQGSIVRSNTYDVPPDKVLNYVFNVKLGEPKYLGVVTIEDARNPNVRGISYGIDNNKNEEIAAWEKISQIYQGSEWVNEVQKRLSELRQ